MKTARCDTYWRFSEEPPARFVERTHMSCTERVEELAYGDSGDALYDVDGQRVTYSREEQQSFHLMFREGSEWLLPRAVLTEKEVSAAGFKILPPEPRQVEKLPRHLRSAAEHIQMRDDIQQEAFDKLIEANGGFVVLSPGKGKTVLAIKALSHWGEHTLLLFENGGIMEQWREELKQWLEPRTTEIGLVQGPYETWTWDRPIVLGMLRSLVNALPNVPEEFFQAFGTVIWDEAHHLAARTYMWTVDKFWGRRVALTATPERGGWENYLYAHIGQEVHRDLSQDIVPRAYFWPVDDENIPDFTSSNMKSYTKLVSVCLGTAGDSRRALPPNERYLDQIVRLLVDASRRGRKALMVSQRKDLPYLLNDQLSNPMNIIDGSVRFSARREMLTSHDLVSVTPQVGSEGLNRVDLDFVLIAFPLGQKASGALRQTVGRVLRVDASGEKPVPEAHFVYPQTSYGKKLADANQKMCEDLGYEIVQPARRRRPRRPGRPARPSLKRNR